MAASVCLSVPLAQRYSAAQRRGSVYVAVTGTAMLITLIGLTSIQLSRLELEKTTSRYEIGYAQQIAQSSVELALASIDLDSNWRTNYVHGTEYTRSPSGVDESFTFRFLDNADSNLADDADEAVEIQGIGRFGDATFVYSVDYTKSLTSDEQFVTVLRSYDTSNGNSTGLSVNLNTWIGQYFIPNLPPSAVSWSVTQIDLSLRQAGSTSQTLNIKVYNADGSGMPTTLIESVAVDESLLPSGSFGWYSVSPASVAGMSVGQGLCVGLESTDSINATCVAERDSTGVAESNAHLISGGSGSWTNSDATQSLLYRVHGVYSTSSGGSGDFTISPGSWKSIAAP